MRTPVIRISLGVFDAEKSSLVEAKLVETRERLAPGIRAMRGNLGYFVGIDRAANAMHNVSLWETIEDANRMASFQPMLDLASEFVALGVRFQRPILNCSTLWSLDGDKGEPLDCGSLASRIGCPCGVASAARAQAVLRCSSADPLAAPLSTMMRSSAASQWR